ncbi:MAG: lectin like domain-containing protein [Synergistaceae bacterium]|jgi:C1A family cysteine protease|nr:lectin like domain-containing protein [Synergistaceae bacterium]
MRKMIRKLLYALAVLALAASGASHAEAAAGLRPVPLNPDFVRYREGTLKTDYPPSPIDWSYVKKARAARKDNKMTLRATGADVDIELPASFDLSALGRTPPVANQKGWGTCWAFAAIEVMESNLINKGAYVPLSELHLAYFTYSFDERNGLPGYFRNVLLRNDEELHNPIFDTGGLPDKVAAMLSRGTGPVLEADAPYPDMGEGDLGWATYLPPAPYAPARFRLGSFLCHVSVEDAKKALMDENFGALSANFDIDGYLGGAHFYSTEGHSNHEVLLVGWDDGYSRENFRSGDVVPAEDGAWKIQNSWGTEFDGEPVGDNGYFYISYEDTTFCDDVPGPYSITLEPLESWDGIYFHDALGHCLNIEGNNLSEHLEAAVFEAVRDEEVVAAGFVTANEDMTYEIQIYRDIPSGEGPGAGKPALAAPQIGAAYEMGYRAVRLKEPVRVKKGERFAVAVKIATRDGSEAYLPAEAMIPGYSDDAAVSPGHSYLYSDVGNGPEWLDTYQLVMTDAWDEYSPRNFDVNVKAFTVAASEQKSSGGGCSAGAFGPFMFLTALAAFAAGRKR